MPTTTIAVKRFQMRFTDADGLPLKVDGIVGPIGSVNKGFLDYSEA